MLSTGGSQPRQPGGSPHLWKLQGQIPTSAKLKRDVAPKRKIKTRQNVTAAAPVEADIQTSGVSQQLGSHGCLEIKEMLALLYFYACPGCLHFADFTHLTLLLFLFASVKWRMCCLQNKAWPAVIREVSFIVETTNGGTTEKRMYMLKSLAFSAVLRGIWFWR